MVKAEKGEGKRKERRYTDMNEEPLNPTFDV